MNLKTWFKKAFTREPIVVGSHWELKDDNPFKNSITVIVHAVKNGWVKYKFCDNGRFSADKGSRFRSVYTRLSD